MPPLLTGPPLTGLYCVPMAMLLISLTATMVLYPNSKVKVLNAVLATMLLACLCLRNQHERHVTDEVLPLRPEDWKSKGTAAWAARLLKENKNMTGEEMRKENRKRKFKRQKRLIEAAQHVTMKIRTGYAPERHYGLARRPLFIHDQARQAKVMSTKERINAKIENYEI